MANLAISVLQSELIWEDRKSNLSRFSEKIKSLSKPGHVVVLPEMFSTGFSMNATQLAEEMEGETIAWMRTTAMQHKVILTGSVIIKENGNFYNRLIWMLPTGQYAAYDKKHLFAYAGEEKTYTAGNQRLVASVNGWKINVIVCYDLRFPVWIRQQYDEGYEYDVLICVANWPERRNHAWKTLLTARAIENQCYVIGCNRVGKDGNDIFYSGDSMIVDPLGEVLVQETNIESILTAKLDREHLEAVREKMPFWKDADHFLLPSKR